MGIKPFDPVILLGTKCEIYPIKHWHKKKQTKKTLAHEHKDSHTRVHTTALDTVTKESSLLTENWLNKLYCIHTMN